MKRKILISTQRMNRNLSSKNGKQMSMNIYIYLDQDNESIIASFTMDCYNELELLMAVKI